MSYLHSDQPRCVKLLARDEAIAYVNKRGIRRLLLYSACNLTCYQLLRRQDLRDGSATPHVLSIDYDDEGELLMTSASDETIQIYNVKDGRHEKSLLSKKYGVKLAKFTHTSSSILYASTKQNRTKKVSMMVV